MTLCFPPLDVTKRTAPCTALADKYMVDWPGICKHFGWRDHKALCGPTIMSMSPNPENSCIWGHAKGCAAHQKPKVDGKPFRLQDHRQQLAQLGLTKVCVELQSQAQAGKKPSGNPKMVGSTPVYPTPHFG